MMDEPVVVKFDFQVRQVKSMADHSINITLNLPEYAADVAAALISRIDDCGQAALVFDPQQNTN